MIDLLGSGFSGRPTEFGYSVRDHAYIISEFLHCLPFEIFDLFGHSLGGSIAIEVATFKESMIRHLILAEPNLLAGGGSFSRHIYSFTENDYIEFGHRNFVNKLIADGDIVQARSLDICAPFAIHRQARSLVEGAEYTWLDLLSALNMQRTLIVGELSAPDTVMPYVHSLGLDVRTVKDAGHCMGWDNPAGLAQVIKKIIA